ncbi:MAG: TIM barrel protein [Candidatus Bathyarchaeia archaeon]|nr:sugar phosphate isomerase/epimerase [Candidatus Bathyarchaeota archaeon]
MFYTSIYAKDVELVSKFPWKIGIVGFMVYPELQRTNTGVAEKLKSILDDRFFDLIELYDVSDEDWEILEKYRYRVDFSIGVQPDILAKGVNPSSLDESERIKAIEVLKNKIRIAGERGIRYLALCSGPFPDSNLVEKAKKALVNTLVELASHASKYGVTILLESFDTKWDRKRLIGSLADASEILEKVKARYNNVALLWDLSHGPLLDEKPEMLSKYRDLIGHIHIGCAKSIDGKLLDTHPGFYRPGAINDERDVARLLEILYDIEYKGAISFEVRPEEGQDPREVLATAKSVLVRAYQIFLERRLS